MNPGKQRPKVRAGRGLQFFARRRGRRTRQKDEEGERQKDEAEGRGGEAEGRGGREGRTEVGGGRTGGDGADIALDEPWQTKARSFPMSRLRLRTKKKVQPGSIEQGVGSIAGHFVQSWNVCPLTTVVELSMTRVSHSARRKHGLATTETALLLLLPLLLLLLPSCCCSYCRSVSPHSPESPRHEAIRVTLLHDSPYLLHGL